MKVKYTGTAHNRVIRAGDTLGDQEEPLTVDLVFSAEKNHTINTEVGELKGKVPESFLRTLMSMDDQIVDATDGNVVSAYDQIFRPSRVEAQVRQGAQLAPIPAFVTDEEDDDLSWDPAERG